MNAFATQLRTELTLSMRNGEQLLVNLFIPLGLLVFFSQVNVLDTGEAEPIDFLAPAVLALAVMSSALVSLGIGTGFERYYGVLKRMGATPLGRPRWVAAKFGAVAVTLALQWLVIALVAVALGWSPANGGWFAAAAAAAFGVAAFGGIALFMAGTLNGLTNLAACNGLYLVLIVTGGMIVPFDSMPGPMRAVAQLFPAAPLADLMIGSLQVGAEVHGASWWVLGAWAVVMPLLAAWRFRWD